MTIDYTKVERIEVEMVEGGAKATVLYLSGRKVVRTWAVDEYGLGDFVVAAEKAGVKVLLPAIQPEPIVPFVTPQGQPVDLSTADTIKVYNGNGRWQANIKTGSRGLQALLVSGIGTSTDAILSALGHGWKACSYEQGQHYLKFARA